MNSYATLLQAATELKGKLNLAAVRLLVYHMCFYGRTQVDAIQESSLRSEYGV